MKKYHLVIEEFVPDKREQILVLLKKILDRKVEYIQVTWKYYDTVLEKKLLDCIADIFDRLGREKDFLVSNQIETNQVRSLLRLRRWLNKYGIYILIGITPRLTARRVKKMNQSFLLVGLVIQKGSYQEYIKYYEKFKTCNTELILNQKELTMEEFREWFWNWQQDRQACWISSFRDICFWILTGTHVADCGHSSCLGSYLCVDKAGKVYFCAQKRSDSFMYYLENAPKELYNDVYNDVLRLVNIKRKSCNAECNSFQVCQGECAFEMKQKCGGQEYLNKVHLIKEYIIENGKNQFMTMKNPLLRQMLISLIAYGIGVE